MRESKAGRGLGPATIARTDWAGRRAYPCSNAQAHFLYQERLQPGCPGRNVFARWRLEGEVLSGDLQDAWRALVARHESLRTYFSEIDGAPVQLVEPRIELQVREIDLTLLSGAESAREAERIAALEAQTPFSLDAAPLIRVIHVRQRPGVSILMVTAHHAVCDGWSMGILAAEMGEFCKARFEQRAPRFEPLRLTYGEHAIAHNEWLATHSFAAERAQLSSALAGYRQFELALDKARPARQTWNGEIASALLETAVTARLAALARERGCTLFAVAYAALLAVLHRAGGETDIALGTQVAGRDEVDLEPLVGTFVNTIVLRTNLRDDPPFVDLLARARDTIADAFDVRHVPIGTVVELVNPKRDPSRNALLSVNFVFQRSFVSNADYGSFALVDLPSRSAGALFDLCFFMVERPEGWRFSCEYNADLFEAGTVKALIDAFAETVRAIAANQTLRLSELPAFDDGRSATEREVHGFVAALLEHGGFGCRDDIFAYGFHSLLALRLVARIKASYGIDVPLRAIVERPTIAAMAAHIDALRSTQPAADAAAPIVTLNAGGSRAPLFFLHSDLYANGLYCRRMAAALGPEQPIHSVAPHGTAGLQLFTDVEAMARDYLPYVRAVQAHGPYRIGGFCASGLVAYELARLLRAEGESVERVVLINASPLPSRAVPGFDAVLRALGCSTALEPALRTALSYNLARLHAALVSGPFATLGFVLQRLAALAKRRTGADVAADPQPFQKRRGETRTENSFAHVVAALTYHPRPYAGEVALIWGADQRVGSGVPRAAWGAVAHGVRVIPMAGGHVEALGEHVDALARAVEDALR
jgi:thioesterase domain-containing protein/aryl carrier-like protein